MLRYPTMKDWGFLSDTVVNRYGDGFFGGGFFGKARLPQKPVEKQVAKMNDVKNCGLGWVRHSTRQLQTSRAVARGERR